MKEIQSGSRKLPLADLFSPLIDSRTIPSTTFNHAEDLIRDPDLKISSDQQCCLSHSVLFSRDERRILFSLSFMSEKVPELGGVLSALLAQSNYNEDKDLCRSALSVLALLLPEEANELALTLAANTTSGEIVIALLNFNFHSRTEEIKALAHELIKQNKFPVDVTATLSTYTSIDGTSRYSDPKIAPLISNAQYDKNLNILRPLFFQDLSPEQIQETYRSLDDSYRPVAIAILAEHIKNGEPNYSTEVLMQLVESFSPTLAQYAFEGHTTV